MAALLLAPAGVSPAILAPSYEDASEGLPHEKPGSADDAGWTGVRFADVNGDGWADLGAIGRKGNGTRVYLGHGNGTWTLSNQGIASYGSGRSDLRFGDLDNDGAQDVVDSNGLVWLGDGAGAWSAGPENLPFTGEDVALGDVDNDGDLDAAVTGHLCCGIRAMLNDGTARWGLASTGLPTAQGGHKLDLVDLDADGCLDVLAVYWYDGGAWLGDCQGNWTDRSAGLKGFQAWDVDAGDVDGDGALDVVFSVFASNDGKQGLRVFLGDGAGNWTAQPVLLGGESWGGMALEDVDGDGALDILAGRDCFGSCVARVVLLLGDGAGGFTEVDAGLPSGVDEMEGLAAADIDHNGVLDAGLAHYGEDGVRVWRDTSEAQTLSVRVLEPRGGEVWVGGGLRSIRWAAAVPPGEGPGSVDLAYSTTGPAGPWVPVASGLPNSGSFAWRVADAASGSAFVRVTVHAGGTSASATNAEPFGLNVRAGTGPRVLVGAQASPARLAALDEERLRASVQNLGFGRVTGSLTLTVSRAGTTLLQAQRDVDLADSKAAALDASWLATPEHRPGSYAVRARFEGTGELNGTTLGLSRGAATSFTLVRPWLDPARTMPAQVPVGRNFTMRVSLTNTGNLPAQNVTWVERVPLAYAFLPNANQVSKALFRNPLGLPAALTGQPPPQNVALDADRKAWVLTYLLPELAAGGTATVRFDLVPLAPGNHTFITHALYHYHYAHRAEPTAFEAGALAVQQVRLA